MKLTGYGRLEWGGTGALAVLLAIGCLVGGLAAQFAVLGYCLAGVIMLLWLTVAAFFRDPNRRPPADPNAILAPADGKIYDIGEVDFNIPGIFENDRALRVGIFLSVLDVHLNRAACDMTVKTKEYRPGAFHDARSPKAGKENESMLIAGAGRIGGFSFPVAIRQVSGAIARRIVCEIEEDGELRRGERYGMIKFGSRTELFLPVEAGKSLTVNEKDKVRAGRTVIAMLDNGAWRQ